METTTTAISLLSRNRFTALVRTAARTGLFLLVLIAFGASTLWAQDSPCGCVVIIDEETIDNDISTIEAAAASHSVLPDVLVNDDHPTENGNPPLHWNVHFPGDVVWLPTGQAEPPSITKMAPVV